MFHVRWTLLISIVFLQVYFKHEPFDPRIEISTTKNKSCTMENNRKQYKYIDNIAIYMFINSHLT